MKGLAKQSQCFSVGSIPRVSYKVKKDLTLGVECGIMIVSGWQALRASLLSGVLASHS